PTGRPPQAYNEGVQKRGDTVAWLLGCAALGAGVIAMGMARSSRPMNSFEIPTMLAELASREQVYRLEFASYLPVRAIPGHSEDPEAFYPRRPSAVTHEPVGIADPMRWPINWRAIGLRPRMKALTCTYLENAGNPGAR